MSLRELTWENHKKAERQEFVKLLFSGKINKKLYAIYLYNQHVIYKNLEVIAEKLGLLDGLSEIKRAEYLYEDFSEIWEDSELPEICETVKKYVNHLIAISQDPNKIMAHIYVRHMGDLYGGQMIASKIPGSGKYYKFNNTEDLKLKIREKLSIDMAPEANVCFEFATKLFRDMQKIKNEFSLE